MTALIRETRIEGPTSGPLAGETLAVKANIAVKDLRWDGGSPALTDVIAPSHATTVARALSAGATVIGHANLHELAFGITSDNAHFGAIESPHGGMAGGSSGGSAAAVATGRATMALGTDTGGSGRLPAAFCGCVGFRPSTGRYPSDGVLTLSPTLDTVSVMAKDVLRLTRLDAVLADVEAARPGSLHGLKLGMVSDVFWETVEPEVSERVEQTVGLLGASGASIEARAAPGLHAALESVALPLVIAETKRWWSPFLKQQLGLSLEAFAGRIASADVAEVFKAVAADDTSDETLAALRDEGRAAVRAILEEAMVGLDALVYPAVPIAAPPLHSVEAQVNGETHALFPLLTTRALVASVTGSPAISLPIVGFDKRPLGLELMSRPGTDKDLLAWAIASEAAICPEE